MEGKAIITEETLLALTECKTLEEILVIALRNKNLKQALKLLSHCKFLQIAYLQNNRLTNSDMIHLKNF